MKNTIIQFSDDDVKELDFLKFVAGSMILGALISSLGFLWRMK